MRRCATGVLSGVSCRPAYAPTEDTHRTPGPQGVWFPLARC